MVVLDRDHAQGTGAGCPVRQLLGKGGIEVHEDAPRLASVREAPPHLLQVHRGVERPEGLLLVRVVQLLVSDHEHALLHPRGDRLPAEVECRRGRRTRTATIASYPAGVMTNGTNRGEGRWSTGRGVEPQTSSGPRGVRAVWYQGTI